MQHHYYTYCARHIICLSFVEILLEAAVIKEKMVEQRECFQNGFGWWAKKFPVPLLREGKCKQVMVVRNAILQVGFRGVEEKKSLDLLLGEKPVDLARVQNFCLRFPLPSIYRIQVILYQVFQSSSYLHWNFKSSQLIWNKEGFSLKKSVVFKKLSIKSIICFVSLLQ